MRLNRARGPAAAGGRSLLGLETDATYTALRAAKPDGKSFAAKDLVLERDAFRFCFESGSFQLVLGR